MTDDMTADETIAFDGILAASKTLKRHAVSRPRDCRPRSRGTEMTDKLKNVLDHGFVRLTDSMGSDLSVVRAARVSYDADWRAGDDTGSDARLIRYLWRNAHTSPFESVTFTFEVKAPIFVFRQWHRHRTWSFNEVSARYAELPSDFYTPAPEIVGRHRRLPRRQANP